MPDRTGLPFGDTADFEAADRGLIDAGDPVVRNEAGQVIWDNGSYGFLTGEAPDTVHPSLWRQSTLVARQGLFEVTDGIYQVRGYDLSNMSVIEGDTGIIVIDPLISTETAAAALALYRKHRGDRPVVAVIHTRSHADHFGGVKGVVSQADVDAGRVQIIAPDGFVEHAIAENVYAGTAMARRAGYMYGAALPRADILYLTEIDRDVAGDTTFPAFDRARWREIYRESHTRDTEDGFGYAFVTYRRAH